MTVPEQQAEEKLLWIGLVEVRPHEGSDTLGGSKGAFVNLVTWASDGAEFGRNADLVFGEMGLFVVDIEDAEPVSIRRQKATLIEEIEDIIDRAEDNPDAIIYGTFRTWKRDTA